MFVGVYRCLQVTDRCLQVFTGVCRCLQVLIGAYRCLYGHRPVFEGA